MVLCVLNLNQLLYGQVVVRLSAPQVWKAGREGEAHCA